MRIFAFSVSGRDFLVFFFSFSWIDFKKDWRIKKKEISMCNKTQVKLFPNFTSKPFDYLVISGVTHYAHNRRL